MEHITVKELGGGFARLTPDEGYILYCSATKTTHSDAEVSHRNMHNFAAYPVGTRFDE